MLKHKKFISHFIWIFLASFVGISISYMAIEGGALAHGAINVKTQSLFSEESSIVTQDIYNDLPKTTNNEIISEKILPDFPGTESILSIGFVGDIFPNTNVPKNIFTDISPYTSKPDIMIGNFEGAVSKNTYSKCKLNSSNCFSFNGDENFLKLLSLASFDVLNIANNHFNDYGEKGQEETIREIEGSDININGIKDEITYISKKNFTIAIVGFSTYSWTMDMNDTKALQQIITEAKQNADVVVVIFHGGGEGIKYSNTPNETEWYLKEDRGNVRDFAHSSIDAGADIVLGSGPHILRGIEKYKNKIIAYSLGNFTSTNIFSNNNSSSKTSAMIETSFNKDGSLISGRIYPLEIDKFGIPHYDLSNTAISIINKLSQENFGEQGISLNNFGSIIIK